MSDNFDFYKPVCGSSCEYPRVNGKDSLDCYLGAVEICYNEFRRRTKKFLNKGLLVYGKIRNFFRFLECSTHDFYATIFHCPFFQLVKKAFAQMYRIECQLKMINGHEEHLKLVK